MNCKFNKDLYPKEAIIKAAYLFTENYNMELDADATYYYVSIEPKESNDESNVEKEFTNEVITQTARLTVSMQTKNVREMIIGRALASTIIDKSDSGYVDDKAVNSEDILNNWFDVNE